MDLSNAPKISAVTVYTIESVGVIEQIQNTHIMVPKIATAVFFLITIIQFRRKKGTVRFCQSGHRNIECFLVCHCMVSIGLGSGNRLTLIPSMCKRMKGYLSFDIPILASLRSLSLWNLSTATHSSSEYHISMVAGKMKDCSDNEKIASSTASSRKVDIDGGLCCIAECEQRRAWAVWHVPVLILVRL